MQFNRALLVLFVTLFTHSAFAQKQPISKILQETINSKGIEAAIEQYRTLKTNHSDGYDFSESELNSLGYSLVQSDRLREATQIFELNIESFPASPNGHDSLGEAFLRAGNHEKAIGFYEKTLALLPGSALDDNAKQSLQKNAENKLGYLRDSSEYRNSTEATDFVANNAELPYGRIHPDAPPETEHWGKLAGVWDCSIERLLPSGNWVQGGRATWVWKYILDGFAVQDLWFVKWINLPPVLAGSHRDVSGTNLRMYLPAEKRWEAVWFFNGANTTSRFDAISDDDKVIMTGVTARGHARITFFDITDTSFEWKSELSKDEGKTWQETTRIHGIRTSGPKSPKASSRKS